MRSRFSFSLPALVGASLLLSLAGQPAAQAADFADSAFVRTWQRVDAPVAAHAAVRSWTWGPAPLCSVREPYKDAPDGSGSRLVQYFDKSRMELNNPAGNPNDPYYVTNGLLAYELISGQLQTGNTTYEGRPPADIPLASDGDDANAPTYRSFSAVTSTPAGQHLSPNLSGQKVTATLDRAGTVGSDAAKGFFPGTVITYYESKTSHNVPQVFWDFINANGVIQVGGKLVTGKLSEPPSFITGLPISEAYWARVKVAGQPTDVLVQAFQRRVLTYLPALQAPWNVQMGNIGLHYLQWRYGNTTCSAQPPAPTPTATPAPPAALQALPFYRLLNPRTGEHFYTTDAGERAKLIAAGYNSERSEGRVWNGPAPDSVPLYRLYNNQKGDVARHLYVAADTERDAAVRHGWVLESTIGYVYQAHAPQTVPMYRWYKGLPANDHLYTINTESFVKLGYTAEGIVFYVLQP